MRISVFGSAELQSVILAMRGMDRELAKQLRKATKQSTLPIWQESVRGNVITRQEDRVLASTATVLVRDENVMLKAGASTKRLSGGATVASITHSVEFGADRSYVGTVKGRNGGQPYKRHTRAQFRPRNIKGNAVYPAAADAIPRIAALWVATTVRTFHEVLEQKNGG